MIQLTKAFLKIFFRNYRAMFFVLLLPAAIFLIAAFLGFEEIIRFDLTNISYIEFLLAGIIGFAIMQTGIYTVAYSLIDLKRTKVLKRLSLTPLTPMQFLSAQGLARFIIAVLQAALLLAVGVLLFETRFDLNLIWLPVILFIASALFLSLGFLIAALARDYEEAAPYASIIGIVLTFMGDIFFPTKNLPAPLPEAAQYLPMKPISELLRFSLLDITPSNLEKTVIVILIWLALLALLASFIWSRRVFRQTG